MEGELETDRDVDANSHVGRGRDAFDRRAWERAYDHLCAASEHGPLEVEDLERLACAAYVTGRSDQSSDVWAKAHQECAEVGDIARAARSAFWLAFSLLNDGQVARGGGWIDRARRLLDERKLECVERGYLGYASALRAIFTGDGEAAYDGFGRAAGVGERFREPELTTLARIGEGRCLIYAGQLEAGLALLDEAMVALGENEVSVIAAGDAYCTAIEGCQEVFDVGRTAEWTAALSRWCEAQPDLVLYRGQCLVHRAEVFQLSGEWNDALAAIERACERLSDPPGQPALALAWYTRGEIHRVRGDLTAAAEAYQNANDMGYDPQPGLALLRFAQGRPDAADASIRRALAETEDPLRRARLLGPFVEIATAMGDLPAATVAVDELSSLAVQLDKPFVHALANHMNGLVRLHESEPADALTMLRAAWTGWREIKAPYDAARTRMRIGLACEALGDAEGGHMETDAAAAALSRLGADPDQAILSTAAVGGPSEQAGALTPREVEVLALVAKGHSNRDIAEQLVIAEKTVASHVGHILTKLAVPSRTAAAAYAFEHGLA